MVRPDAGLPNKTNNEMLVLFAIKNTHISALVYDHKNCDGIHLFITWMERDAATEHFLHFTRRPDCLLLEIYL